MLITSSLILLYNFAMEFLIADVAFAIGTSFRLFVASVIIMGSASIFNGIILPIGIIIFILIICCFFLQRFLVESN